MLSFISKLLTGSLLNEFKWFLNKNALSSINLFVFDVDGVLTEGGLWIQENGEILRRYDARDGMGIKLLKDQGLKIAFLSGGTGKSISNRAEQLDIDYCIQGAKDKSVALTEIFNELNCTSDETAFVGDDLYDLAVRKRVKLFFSPVDAPHYVRNEADAVLQSLGGRGAVRELAERVLQARSNGKHEAQ